MAQPNDRSIVLDPRVDPVEVPPAMFVMDRLDKSLLLKAKLSFKKLPVSSVLRRRPFQLGINMHMVKWLP